MKHVLHPTEQFTVHETGLFSTVLLCDDSLPAFLAQGGAADLNSFMRFLLSRLDRKTVQDVIEQLSIQPPKGGCSVCSVKSRDGAPLFGRNFDFRRCNMLIVKSKPETGYASVSTVNPDFITLRSELGLHNPKLEKVFRLLVYYLPMDGMNEKGLCVSINNIRDRVDIHQTGGMRDQMASGLVRTLLDCADDVDEALRILRETNFHTTEGYLIHLAIADVRGRCVCAEYIDN